MMGRPSNQQSVHDLVVRESAKTYTMAKAVYTNPNGQHNFHVAGEYPDVVALMSDYATSETVIIEEIETEDSVNQTERDVQWKKYSDLGHAFQLVVPRSKLALAYQLSYGLRIHRIQGYTLVNGQVYFDPL